MTRTQALRSVRAAALSSAALLMLAGTIAVTTGTSSAQTHPDLLAMDQRIGALEQTARDNKGDHDALIRVQDGLQKVQDDVGETKTWARCVGLALIIDCLQRLLGRTLKKPQP